MSKLNEMILVAKRDKVFDNEKDVFQGVANKKSHEHSINKIVKAIGDDIEVMRRGDAEENPLYKQPIPYAVIKRGEEYYGYTRLEGGGESRLHGKISLGIGGHCNAIEGVSDFDDLLMVNLERELEEEVSITSKDGFDVHQTLDVIGLINDDENEVGRVHIGILAFIELSDNAEVSVNETEQLKGEWFTKEQLIENYERLESWSQFVVDAI